MKQQLQQYKDKFKDVNTLIGAKDKKVEEIFDDIDKNFRVNLADGVSAVRIDREEWEQLRQKHITNKQRTTYEQKHTTQK